MSGGTFVDAQMAGSLQIQESAQQGHNLTKTSQYASKEEYREDGFERLFG